MAPAHQDDPKSPAYPSSRSDSSERHVSQAEPRITLHSHGSKRWSHFTTSTFHLGVGSSTLRLPGLRRSSEVNVDISSSQELFKQYTILQELGNGAFGVVFMCKHNPTNTNYAVKGVKIQRMKNVDNFMKELAIARRLNHDNIVRLHAAFKAEQMFYLVMEHLAGGDLTMVLRKNRCGVSSERVTIWASHMLEAIAYLHHHYLCHRDIKAENFMLKRAGVEYPLKLIDFGLSCHFQKHQCLTDRVGSPYSMAPEVMRREPYTENCDVWSVGCVISELCVGHPPYVAPTRAELVEMISEQEITFDEKEWRRHPPELQRLVESMCNRSRFERLSASETIADNPFLSDLAQRRSAGSDKLRCSSCVLS
eukprot:NODE_6372_length_1677_cov_6.894194.p1 GENE.NODE_6372_length_1677_cov_6.894194~~NODE_6372_length_1677_cov_6.894194.p1  ORF type:complete len:423 (-),score=36.83 NODE_6372_length_1677_cov_6.894194:407-1501(-)